MFRENADRGKKGSDVTLRVGIKKFEPYVVRLEFIDLVYPPGFEPGLDGVGGRNVIQLHYEYDFC